MSINSDNQQAFDRHQRRSVDGMREYNKAHAEVDRRKEVDEGVNALARGISAAMMASPDFLHHLDPFAAAELILSRWPSRQDWR